MVPEMGAGAEKGMKAKVVCRLGEGGRGETPYHPGPWKASCLEDNSRNGTWL
jgi:hypothetical protein